MIDFPGKPQYDADDLRQVVEILRGEDGCPWDRVQTHESLRRNLLEECAELCEAIDRADPAMLREELGDVWLQVIFHASIEQEKGTFDLDDVADAECRKLISRHPHVFGEAVFSDLGEELKAWEELKRKEKHQRTAADAMDAVCRTLPGLWRAEKVQKKAAAAGEDPLAPADAAAALRRETEAFAGQMDAGDAETQKAALGRVLYAAVYAARRMGIDPEEALHARCEEHIRLFREWEGSENEDGDAVLEGRPPYKLSTQD